jgi:hypothetical protein
MLIIAGEGAKPMQHVVVYRKNGRFAGWPANYGVWSWGNEIVTGFTEGALKPNPGFHAIDNTRPVATMQARSLDGGASWTVGPTPAERPGGGAISADEHQADDVRPRLDQAGLALCPGDLDFSHPDFALLCARTGLRAGARSWFYTSNDRCRTWSRPYELPMFGLPGVAARTDYLVDDPRTCTLFLTAAKSDGAEGRVFCARTEDGGRSFRFLSFIGPEPEGYTIMPASLRLPSSRILCAVRCSGRRTGSMRPLTWIDLYASDDEGSSWTRIAQPVEEAGRGGNPPTLAALPDGRLCLVYGFRGSPCGLRAMLGAGDGEKWAGPLVLRDDAGDHDIGYPRTVLRPDGTLVTVYYYNDSVEGERYIAATLWRPS